jgi:hypothetical protein
MKKIEQSPFDRFLRRMRAGGRSNMYGAVPYLMEAFGLDRHAAFRIVCDWLDRQAEATRTEEPGSRSETPSRPRRR